MAQGDDAHAQAPASGADVERCRALVRFREGLPQARRWARYFHLALGAPLPFRELRSFAWEGLWFAVTTYREPSSVTLDTWTRRRIFGAMVDGLRGHGVLPRHGYRPYDTMVVGDDFARALGSPALLARSRARLAHVAAGLPLGVTERERVVFELDAPSPEDIALFRERRAAVRAAIEALDEPRDRTLLTAYFLERRTLADAGACVGIATKGGASRALQRALASLREELLAEDLIGEGAFTLTGARLTLDRERGAGDDDDHDVEELALDADEATADRADDDEEAHDDDDDDEHAIGDPGALLRLLGGAVAVSPPAARAPRAPSTPKEKRVRDAAPRAPELLTPAPLPPIAPMLRAGEALAGRIGHGVVIRRRAALPA